MTLISNNIGTFYIYSQKQTNINIRICVFGKNSFKLSKTTFVDPVECVSLKVSLANIALTISAVYPEYEQRKSRFPHSVTD